MKLVRNFGRPGSLPGVVFSIAALFAFPSWSLTIVVDFNDPAQAPTSDIFSNANTVGTLEVEAFGFAELDRDWVERRIFDRVLDQYFGLPTTDADPLSPIPVGMQLDLDIVLGDIGSSPANGDPDYFAVQVGSGISGPSIGGRGIAWIGYVRDAVGMPSRRAFPGAVFASVFSDTVAEIGGLDPPDALISGDIDVLAIALGDLIAHEIGHGLSLHHLDWTRSDLTLSGTTPLMASGAAGMPFSEYLTDRSWHYDSLSQLAGAVGLRPIPEPSSAVLVALGLLSLRSLRRSRRSFRETR